MDRNTFTKLRVLVADQSYMAGLTTIMLRSLGIRSITEAHDSGAALLALKRSPFDVLIIDDALGPIDTVVLARQLRADQGNPNRLIPVLMVFTAADKARILSARDAGVTEFLRKPISATLIGSRLAQTFDNPRSFVSAPAYVGPDRRRRSALIDEPDRRSGS